MHSVAGGEGEAANLDSSAAAAELRAAFIHVFILQRFKCQAGAGCWGDSWKQAREVLETRQDKLTLREAVPLHYPRPHVEKLVQAAFLGSTDDAPKLARAFTKESHPKTDPAPAGEMKPR